MDRQVLGAASDAELCDTFDQLCAVLASVKRGLLSVVAELDRREAWKQDGSWSMGAWIAQRASVSRTTGAEQARVAASLESLPAIASAFGSGELSYDQTRALCWFATPESDASLASSAGSWTVAALDRVARRAREVAQTSDHPELRLSPARDERFDRISGQLLKEDAASVRSTLEGLCEQGAGAPGHAQRMADALVELCSGGEARSVVVVHADAATLAGGQGLAELADGSRLPPQVVSRLACDGRIQNVLEELRADPLSAPRPLGIGRASRVVPPALMRLLRFRDHCCRFPGCERRTYVDAHHIVAWLNGGSTDLSNLLLLCGHHHKLVHEGGWKIAGHPDHQIHFVKPDGSLLRARPVPMRPDVKERIWGRQRE